MAIDKIKFLSEVEVDETLTANKDIVVKQGAEIEGSLLVKNNVEIGGVDSNQGANLLVNGEITSKTKESIKAWSVANGVVTFNNILKQLSTGKLYKLTVSAKRNVCGYETKTPNEILGEAGSMELQFILPGSECSTIIQFNKDVDINGTEFYIGKLPRLVTWDSDGIPLPKDSYTYFPEDCGSFKHMDAYVRIYDTSDKTDTENKGAFKLIMREFGSSFDEIIFDKEILQSRIAGLANIFDVNAYKIDTIDFINGKNYSIEITPLN